MDHARTAAAAGRDPGPARLFALLVGGLLVLGGIGGFLYESSFSTGDRLASDEIAGILATNGWHNLIHLLTGLAGLALASRAPRPYALAVGGAYLALALWGLIETERGFGNLLELVPVDTQDNLLHLLIGLTGLGAGLAERSHPLLRPGRARERPAASAAGRRSAPE